MRFKLVPIDVYGPDFPGETICVLNEEEKRQFGGYRTQRPVLAGRSKSRALDP
jgi:hypothetical protein